MNWWKVLQLVCRHRREVQTVETTGADGAVRTVRRCMDCGKEWAT